MALIWSPDPVSRLAPPLASDLADRALKRVFHRLANELHEERTETQTSKQVKGELARLEKATHAPPRRIISQRRESQHS